VVNFDYGFDPGLGAWYENGTAGLNNGLPAGKNFTSQITNSVTGTSTAFHLQPAGGPNVLKMGDITQHPVITSCTLSLATPARYSSLAILATSGFGSGTLTLNFTDGSTSGPYSYDAPDWNIFVGNDMAKVALGPVGRNGDVGSNGLGFVFDGAPDYVMYETDLNLTAQGLDGKVLQSITFTSASNPPDPFAITGVFAVSGVGVGQAVPEPTTLTLRGLGALGLAVCRRRGRPDGPRRL
jgi:hypothetical protein